MPDQSVCAIESYTAALAWRCLTGCAPSYLSDLCRPASVLAFQAPYTLFYRSWPHFIVLTIEFGDNDDIDKDDDDHNRRRNYYDKKTTEIDDNDSDDDQYNETNVNNTNDEN